MDGVARMSNWSVQSTPTKEGDDDANNDWPARNERGEDKQKLKDDLALCTKVYHAVAIATKILNLEDGQQFKYLCRSSRRAGQRLQTIIWDAATSLDDEGRAYVLGWTDGFAASILIDSQKQILNEATFNYPTERSSTSEINRVDSPLGGHSNKRRRIMNDDDDDG